MQNIGQAVPHTQETISDIFLKDFKISVNRGTKWLIDGP